MELKATIGVDVTLDTPNVLVRIWRAGTEIFYARVELEETFNDDGIISLHMVDINVPSGVQNYQLIVENQDVGSVATVVGPVIFQRFGYRRLSFFIAVPERGFLKYL
ncbi:hypothetical protein ACFSQ7_17885 [Paenibacillus rhizoplanae]